MGKSFLVSMMACLVVAGSAVAGDWVDLFDGKTLNGWSVHSGFAKYEVEDGTIVGTAVKGSPNSFLCTDKQYGDFVLEFEVKCDPKLNSGVQFRSLIAEKEMVFWFLNAKGEPRKRTIPPDRVYGYQVEIADAERGTSGGVYDEARRGFFLCDVSEAPKASKATAGATRSRPGSTRSPAPTSATRSPPKASSDSRSTASTVRTSNPTRSAGGTSGSRSSSSGGVHTAEFVPPRKRGNERRLPRQRFHGLASCPACRPADECYARNSR